MAPITDIASRRGAVNTSERSVKKFKMDSPKVIDLFDWDSVDEDPYNDVEQNKLWDQFKLACEVAHDWRDMESIETVSALIEQIKPRVEVEDKDAPVRLTVLNGGKYE